MNRLIRVFQVIFDVATGHVAAWLVFAMMAMVLIEVVSRYVLLAPLMIADEMGGYMVIAITFLGLAYTWRERSHISVEFVINKLPIRARRYSRFITLLLATIVTALLAYACYDLMAYSASFGIRSGTWLRTPLVWPQTFMIVGSVLLLFQLIVDLIRTSRDLRVQDGKDD